MEQQHVVTDHPPVPAGGFFRSLTDQDNFNRMAVQARGMAYLLGHAAEIEAVMPERIRSAAWGLEDLIDSMHNMVGEVLFIPGIGTDEFEKMAAQAAGVAYLLGHFPEVEAVMPERVSSAAWGLQDLIDGMVALANQRDAGHD